MNEAKFEDLLARYGADLESWPSKDQPSAKAFAKTETGQAMLEAELQLDELFASNIATGHEHTEDRNLEAFLSRLDAVPTGYSQEIPEKKSWLVDIQRLFASFDVELSPGALVSQMAALVVALGMGIMVGFSSEDSGYVSNFEAEEIDISEAWFADLSDAGVSDVGQSAEPVGE
ncbi:MAG: hypothetical protein AB3N28_03340 [Kordiimonas sp.]